MITYNLRDLFLLFFTSFILSAVSLTFLRRISVKHNLLVKEKKVPYIGGLGFSLSFISCLILFCLIKGITLPFGFIWIIAFSLLLLAIEFIDDLRDFPLNLKLIFQVIFIFLFLLYGKKIQIYFLPKGINYLISFLWIMGITNAFNHLDVADGLCGGISLIISLTFFTVFLKIGDFLSFIFAGLSGVLFAFILFNFPAAKIFMGNSGSHFLGFLFATLSICGDYAGISNSSALFLPVLILGLPIIDTFYLIVVRSRKNISPLRKSDDHIILRYLLKGYSYRRSLVSIYVLTVFWCLSGIFILKGINLKFLISLIIASLGAVLMMVKTNIGKVSGS